MAGWTGLVNQSRHDARRRLGHDVRRLGAGGVVIAGRQMRVREPDCPAAAGRRDHIVEVTFTGTAIARFAPASRGHAGPAAAVMPLGPQRRQASSARHGRPSIRHGKRGAPPEAITQGEVPLDAGAKPQSAER
jgi:hypothetical protein